IGRAAAARRAARPASAANACGDNGPISPCSARAAVAAVRLVFEKTAPGDGEGGPGSIVKPASLGIAAVAAVAAGGATRAVHTSTAMAASRAQRLIAEDAVPGERGLALVVDGASPSISPPGSRFQGGHRSAATTNREIVRECAVGENQAGPGLIENRA